MKRKNVFLVELGKLAIFGPKLFFPVFLWIWNNLNYSSFQYLKYEYKPF